MAKARMRHRLHRSSRERIELGDAEVLVLARNPRLGVELWQVDSHGRLWTAFHNTYAFCQPYRQEDEQAWIYRRRRYAADVASTMLIEPGEVHRTIRGGEAAFHLLFVAPETAAQLTDQSPLHFHEGQTNSPMVRRHFQQLCSATKAEGGIGLHSEEALLDFLHSAAEAHSETPHHRAPPACRIALRRVRDFLHDHHDDKISLDQVARVAGLSRFHLSRMFRQEVGVPIHRYQTLVRLDKARSLLLAGKSISETATDLGFYDQPHFHQAFLRTYGLTPGAFVGGTCSVPEAARTVTG